MAPNRQRPEGGLPAMTDTSKVKVMGLNKYTRLIRGGLWARYCPPGVPYGPGGGPEHAACERRQLYISLGRKFKN